MVRARLSVSASDETRTGLADTDYINLATCGGFIKGKRRTVTVFTCDDPEEIETRLKVGKFLAELFAHDILKENLAQSPEGVPTFRPGKVVACDPHLMSVRKILVKKLAFNIDYPDEALRDGFRATPGGLPAAH